SVPVSRVRSAWALFAPVRAGVVPPRRAAIRPESGSLSPFEPFEPVVAGSATARHSPVEGQAWSGRGSERGSANRRAGLTLRVSVAGGVLRGAASLLGRADFASSRS